MRLPDGRCFAVALHGPPDRPPILYLHGFLGSRLEPLAALPEDTRILAVDRPGYGGSDPQRAPSLCGFGTDLAAALDRLGVAEVALVGVSAGAPYAVAAGIVLGARVRACVLAAGVAGPGAVATAGGAVRLFHHRPRALAHLLRTAAPALRDTRVAHAFLALAVRLAQERFATVAERSAVLRALSRSVAEAVRAGAGGALADIDLLGRPWDVDPGELRVPCLVLHAKNDPVVPAAHAAWYGRHLPRARVELVPADGHIAFLVGQARRIAAALGHPAAFERLQTDRYKP